MFKEEFCKIERLAYQVSCVLVSDINPCCKLDCNFQIKAQFNSNSYSKLAPYPCATKKFYETFSFFKFPFHDL